MKVEAEVRGGFPVDTLIRDAIDNVELELRRAMEKFPPMHSAHEGYAVTLEELDELWQEVQRKNDGSDPGRPAAMRKEAIQVAAMATRFVIDCC